MYRTKRQFVEESLEAALAEDPRPGGKRKLTGSEEALLIATACSTPPTGRARWTLALLADAVASLETETDPVERQRFALAFWDHVVDGADSIVFRLMYNTLRATYEPALPALAAVMTAEVCRPEAYRELAGTIAAGDPAAAKRAAVDLLQPATEAMLAVITNLEGHP